MKSPCSAYLCARVLLGSLDLASDLLVCVHLVLERQLAWAALIGLFILTGVIASASLAGAFLASFALPGLAEVTARFLFKDRAPDPTPWP